MDGRGIVNPELEETPDCRNTNLQNRLRFARGGEEALNTIFMGWAVARQACDSPKRADNMLGKGAPGRQSIRWIVAYNIPQPSLSAFCLSGFQRKLLNAWGIPSAMDKEADLHCRF